MTPEAQRIAIAEACGWRFPHGTTITHASQLCRRPSGDWATQHSEVPDYVNDLNAMHEAEKVLWQHDWLGYYSSLAAVMRVDLEDMALIHATAAQRAEAFLRTLNLWTP